MITISFGRINEYDRDPSAKMAIFGILKTHMHEHFVANLAKPRNIGMLRSYYVVNDEWTLPKSELTF